MGGAPGTNDGSRLRIALLAVIAVAAALRLAATWNDLWFDEVWTLTLIGTLHSPLGIVTELRHDNNHILNTLVLYLLRPFGSDWLYRLPAWIAGVATVVLGARLAAEGDGPAAPASPADAPAPVRALVAAGVLGVSYPLVQYGSEARGYAFALAFGLLAVARAVADGVRTRSTAAPVVWVALSLALLGHALALHLFVALVAWSTVRVLRRGDGWRAALGTLAWWWVVPAAAFVALYLGFLRGITVGGGNREGLLPPLLRAIAVTTGLPSASGGPVLLAVAALGLAIGIGWLVRRRSDLWVLYLVGIVVSPVLLAVVNPTDLYAERYFLVSMLLWLLLVARVVAWAVALGGTTRVVAAVLFAAFAVGNGVRIERLLRDGRGQYQEALAYMVRHTTDGAVTIGSDHDFRNRLLVEYFGPRAGGAKPVRYVRANEVTPPGPSWYLAHRWVGETPPPDTIVYRGASYRLETAYPSAPLSGWRWFVFRRVG